MEPFDLIVNLFKVIENRLTKIDLNEFVMSSSSYKGDDHFFLTYTLSISVKSKRNTDMEKVIVLNVNAQHQSHFEPYNPQSKQNKKFYLISDITTMEGAKTL
jgi:hypothetical protein